MNTHSQRWPCTLAAAALLVAGGFAAQAAEMQPGLWEHTNKMTIPGMPVELPAASFTQCYTAKDIASNKQYSKQRDDNPDCEMQNMKQSGDKFSYDIVCTGATPMTGSFELVQKASSFSGSGTMVMNGQSMLSEFSARRLGDCR